MSISVRKTSKGLTIRTTGRDAQRLMEHLDQEKQRNAGDALAQAGGKRTSAVAIAVNVRVRTKSQGT